jgi:hypothetical protein
MAKYRRPRPPAPDRAIQVHGATARLGVRTWTSGVTRLAHRPVSREMILNFVAEHSLGLPRSY